MGSTCRTTFALDAEVIGDALKLFVFPFIYNRLAWLVDQHRVLKKSLSCAHLPPGGLLVMDSFPFSLLWLALRF